ncbi:MAG: hypothetical protein WBD51_05505 [Burkholderiaceae bacterium]
MIGKVLAVNSESGYVAVRAPGGVTVLELLGGNEVLKGDVLVGDFESLTGELFFNQTRHDELSVVVQDVNCTPADARRMLASW